MKSKLNLTIEETLLREAKLYAEKQHTSVSELVEGYFRKIVKPAKRKNILDLVDALDHTLIDPNADLKTLYYQDQKHGG